MLAAKSMASGDPVDMQREQRWPSNRTGETPAQQPSGVKVQFLPHEENSDYSDTEGMMHYNAATGKYEPPMITNDD